MFHSEKGKTFGTENWSIVVWGGKGEGTDYEGAWRNFCMHCQNIWNSTHPNGWILQCESNLNEFDFRNVYKESGTHKTTKGGKGEIQRQVREKERRKEDGKEIYRYLWILHKKLLSKNKYNVLK